MYRQQARVMGRPTLDLFMRQRNQLINRYPHIARINLAQIDALLLRVKAFWKSLDKEDAQSNTSPRMMSTPGLGPVTPIAVEVSAPTL